MCLRISGDALRLWDCDPTQEHLLDVLTCLGVLLASVPVPIVSSKSLRMGRHHFLPRLDETQERFRFRADAPVHSQPYLLRVC